MDIIFGRTLHCFVCLFILVFGAAAEFNPEVRVDNCAKNTLLVTITNAQPDGILYVQGQGLACKQTTSAGSVQHRIDFTACNIQWNKPFTLVVQKHALYEKSYDKHIPVTCTLDISDIAVRGSLNVQSGPKEPSQYIVVKPTATMTLYNNDREIGEQTVTLSDIITMVLKLDGPFIEDFDIKAISCAASTLQLLNNSCSVDTELFPHFSKIQRGHLSATFGAFRLTNLGDASVAMPFSCSLQTCLDNCDPTICDGGTKSYGRKRRENRNSSANAEDSGSQYITVGSTIYVRQDNLTREADMVNTVLLPDPCLCVGEAVLIGLVTIIIMSIVMIIVVLTVKFCKAPKHPTRMFEKLKMSDMKFVHSSTPIEYCDSEKDKSYDSEYN